MMLHCNLWYPHRYPHSGLPTLARPIDWLSVHFSVAKCKVLINTNFVTGPESKILLWKNIFCILHYKTFREDLINSLPKFLKT